MSHSTIKAIIGLGNIGKQYEYTRHNIGFLVVDFLADRFGGSWHKKDLTEVAEISINGNKIVLLKPQTFMNSSGKVMPWLNKQGIKAENIIVVHDELEIPFGKVKIKVGGGARGHNGIRSIIEHSGPDFARLCFGIGRPETKEMVGTYVLQDFSEKGAELDRMIEQAAHMLEDEVSKNA